ncbi:unnamed protein product, partial [Ectocarpus fasciculatus]
LLSTETTNAAAGTQNKPSNAHRCGEGVKHAREEIAAISQKQPRPRTKTERTRCHWPARVIQRDHTDNHHQSIITFLVPDPRKWRKNPGTAAASLPRNRPGTSRRRRRPCRGPGRSRSTRCCSSQCC